MTNSFLHPSAILLLGALLVPVFRGTGKRVYMLLLPLVSLYNILCMPSGDFFQVEFAGTLLTMVHVDKLSFVFALIFSIIAVIGMLFAIRHDSDVQHVAGLMYAGAVQGVVFAGDMLTLFLFWEALTITAALIIWSHNTKQARGAGFRYMLVHAAGGLCLLLGIIMRYQETGSLTFGHIGLDGQLSSLLIFLGFGVNAAWPGLHAWLTDAYPSASPTGTVFLSAFTTKSAVYVLARSFAGTEELIWIGAFMAVCPLFFAAIENDLRRVLSYSLINQIGFMMVGVGIGTELSLNGTCAHAFAHILYKALLFMSMGAVMHRTGKINATDLGGLYKSMPWTTLFCIIGAASISFPLTCGFVSKSMIISAAGEGHYALAWFALVSAAAGAFHYAGIKVPFFAFYGQDAGHRVKEAPVHMLIAMGIVAFLCIAVGVYPKPLYDLLPYPVEYVPYTASHVLTQLQLLFFSALAFTLLMLSGLYPAAIRCVNLDTDFVYRFGGRFIYRSMDTALNAINRCCDKILVRQFPGMLASWFRQAPLNITLLILSPVLGAESGPESMRRRIIKTFDAGLSPAGLSVAVAALFVCLFIVAALFLQN